MAPNTPPPTAPSKHAFLTQGFEILTAEALAPDERKCAICLEGYGSSSGSSSGSGTISDDGNSNSDATEAPVRLRACGHVFGLQCIKGWSEAGGRKTACPLCRVTLFEDAAELRVRITNGNGVVVVVEV